MCRDQNLISGDERDSVACWLALTECMKIEKPGVSRPLLGPAKTLIVTNIKILIVYNYYFFLKHNSKTQIMTMQKISRTLEPQHLAAEMYSVQSFVVCKVKNKIGN